jgi:hypothetical protein
VIAEDPTENLPEETDEAPLGLSQSYQNMPVPSATQTSSILVQSTQTITGKKDDGINAPSACFYPARSLARPGNRHLKAIWANGKDSKTSSLHVRRRCRLTGGNSA